MNNIATEGPFNDSIVKAAMCLHFTQAMSAVTPGTPFTPYMSNLAKAIFAAEGDRS